MNSLEHNHPLHHLGHSTYFDVFLIHSKANLCDCRRVGQKSFAQQIPRITAQPAADAALFRCGKANEHISEDGL